MPQTVSQTFSQTLLEPPVDYRRTARRVRCQLGHDPMRKQHALLALAKRADRMPRVIQAEAVPPAESGVRDFAAAVSAAMDGPILRFSQRQQLIRQAEALGIRRFDANLLIAAVQHRLGSEKSVGSGETTMTHRRQWRIGGLVGVAVGLQGIILLAAWGLLHS